MNRKEEFLLESKWLTHFNRAQTHKTSETHESSGEKQKSMIFHVRLHFPLDAHDEFFNLTRELICRWVDFSIVEWKKNYRAFVFKMKENKIWEFFIIFRSSRSNSNNNNWISISSSSFLSSSPRGRIWFLFILYYIFFCCRWWYFLYSWEWRKKEREEEARRRHDNNDNAAIFLLR